jgi:phage host-nuclease inhibitor protein Gam
MEPIMTKTEQKKVSKILSRLQGMQAEFEALVTAMDEKISNRSERYAESEKGQDEQGEFGTLQDALNSIENAIDYLGNIDLSEAQ